jgi:hypothetical protein
MIRNLIGIVMATEQNLLTLEITEPFVNYVYAEINLSDFDKFVQTLINQIQETSSLAENFAQFLQQQFKLPETQVADALKTLPRPATEMQTHQELFAQLMLTRMVDSFLTYLSDLLTLIFRSRPEMMKTKKEPGDTEISVALEYIPEYKTMDELISALIERRVHRLSYLGVRKLNEYMSRQFGLTIATDDKSLDVLVLLIELRNLLAHNRGIVNRVFCERVVQDWTHHLGKPLNVGYSNITYYLHFLMSRAQDLDARAIAKFKLPLWPVPSKPMPTR